MVPNAPKWYRSHQNMSLGSNGAYRVRSLRNNSMQLRGMNFCTSLECFALSFVRQLNGPKCMQMVRNAPKHEFRVQWGGRVRSSRKTLTRLHGTNFCTSSKYFAPSFVRQPNGRKCTQMVRNTQKLQFRVKWGGSAVFVAKNSEATLWHELLH